MIPINDKEKAQETINEEEVEVIDSVPEEETEAAGESAAAENAETAEDADFEPVEGENGRKESVLKPTPSAAPSSVSPTP